MAVFREAPTCIDCGKQIKALHSEQNGLIGDTFIGWDYVGHVCSEPRKKLLRLSRDMGITELEKALTDPKVNQACEDIQSYGWILCSTDNSPEEEEVLITDGINIGLGIFNINNKWSSTGWSVLGKGLTQLNIIAWTYKPDLSELQECLKLKAQNH